MIAAVASASARRERDRRERLRRDRQQREQRRRQEQREARRRRRRRGGAAARGRGLGSVHSDEQTTDRFRFDRSSEPALPYWLRLRNVLRGLEDTHHTVFGDAQGDTLEDEFMQMLMLDLAANDEDDEFFNRLEESDGEDLRLFFQMLSGHRCSAYSRQHLEHSPGQGPL